ncbi:MAG: Dabb family protein [Gemmatimonadales bacterium]
MLHHTVLIRWKPETTPEVQCALAGRLLALQGVVPEIRAIHTGANRDPDGRTDWPFVLLVIVDDLDALQRYIDHPAHQAVARELAAAREARMAVDVTVRSSSTP